jgi:hypothetical protein
VFSGPTSDYAQTKTNGNKEFNNAKAAMGLTTTSHGHPHWIKNSSRPMSSKPRFAGRAPSAGLRQGTTETEAYAEKKVNNLFTGISSKPELHEATTRTADTAAKTFDSSSGHQKDKPSGGVFQKPPTGNMQVNKVRPQTSGAATLNFYR